MFPLGVKGLLYAGVCLPLRGWPVVVGMRQRCLGDGVRETWTLDPLLSCSTCGFGYSAQISLSTLIFL